MDGHRAGSLRHSFNGPPLEENGNDTTQPYVAGGGFADLHSIKWLDAHGEALFLLKW
jgi:hypothetical protein